MAMICVKSGRNILDLSFTYTRHSFFCVCFYRVSTSLFNFYIRVELNTVNRNGLSYIIGEEILII